MREIIDEVSLWFKSGEPFALATVTRTWSSVPRPVGSAMAISESGEVVGSVSGGCVEGEVFEVGRELLRSGHSKRVTYGVSDENAYAVGLTCGGTIELFIQCINSNSFPEFEVVVNAVRQGKPIAIATLIEGTDSVGSHLIFNGNEVHGTLNSAKLEHSVVADGRGLLDRGETRVVKFGPNGERRMDQVSVLIESYTAPAKLIVFGATDFAVAVVRIGKFLGYRVIVCDARGLFVTEKRFPEADEIVIAWPHKYLPTVEVDSRTAICVLTHDPKFDVPVLEIALRTKAGYVGAMGSRRTHDDRLRRLREAGLSEVELSRLRSPIGLDLGARTTEETAISIAAEMISDLVGGTNEALSKRRDPIHRVSLASETSALSDIRDA